MTAAIDDLLIDRIYEAAVVPAMWQAVLTQLSERVGAADGLIGSARFDVVLRIVSQSDRLTEAWAAVNERFPAASNERTRRVLRQGQYGFITDQDVFTLEEMRSDPLYKEILVPRGFGSGIATSINVPSGDSFIINLERSVSVGPFGIREVDALNRLRPHLARAALVSSRLAIERAKGAVAALEMIGLPAAVLGAGGRTLAANESLSRLAPNTVQDRPSRLALTHPPSDKLLSNAVDALVGGSHEAAVRSIPVPAKDEQPPVIVHLAPIRGFAHDIFTHATAIIVVTPVVPREVPTATVVQGLFDLTPAEAKLAALVAGGHPPREAAGKLGWTYETTRTTLKRVMMKVGVTRQTELVGLLTSASWTAN